MADSDGHYELADFPDDDEPGKTPPANPFAKKQPPAESPTEPGPGRPTPTPTSAREINRAKVDRDAFDAGSFNDLSDDERARLADKAGRSRAKHVGDGIYVRLSPDGRIDEPKPCVLCGTDLIGQPVDSVCPGCGVVVLRTLKGDRLHYGPPKWIGQVALGAAVLVGSVLLLMLGLAIIKITGLVITPALDEPKSGGASNAAAAQHTLLMLNAGLYFVVSVFWLIGFWLFTKQEPGASDEHDQTKLDRRLIRSAGAAGVVLGGIELFLVVGLGMDWAAQLPMLSDLAAYVGIVLLCRYAYYLALRLPDEPMAQQTKVIGIGWAVLLPVLWLGRVLNFVTQSGADAPGGIVAGVAGLIGGVGMFGVVLLALGSLILLIVYRARIDHAVIDSRKLRMPV